MKNEKRGYGERNGFQQMEATMEPVRTLHESHGLHFGLSHLALGASFALLVLIVIGLL